MHWTANVVLISTKHRDILRKCPVARRVLGEDPRGDGQPRGPLELLRQVHDRTPGSRFGEEGPLPLPRASSELDLPRLV